VTPQKAELKRRLGELHAELARTQSVEGESRELLEHVRRDIEAVLDRSEDPGQTSLRGRLEAAISHFEESHPILTDTMRRVINQLANLGI
jgi:hypothetical protein